GVASGRCRVQSGETGCGGCWQVNRADPSCANTLTHAVTRAFSGCDVLGVSWLSREQSRIGPIERVEVRRRGAAVIDCAGNAQHRPAPASAVAPPTRPCCSRGVAEVVLQEPTEARPAFPLASRKTEDHGLVSLLRQWPVANALMWPFGMIMLQERGQQ